MGILTEQTTFAFSMALEILGRRYVSWGFNVDNLEDWLTTLEKLTDNVDFSITHRNDWLALNRLKWELTAAYDLWKKQSQEISEAPQAQDLQEYMADFATSVLKEQAQALK